MSLVALADVKQILRIPDSYTADDAILQDCCDAAEEYVLDRARYTLTAIANRVDYFSSAAFDRRLYLTRRPVSEIVSAQWKTPEYPASDWYSASATIEDADEGVVTVSLASDELLPEAVRVAKWSRGQLLPMRITYNVSALTSPPARLVQAAERLAAFLFDKMRGAAGRVQSLGDSRVELDLSAVPADVEALLSAYVGRNAARWL